MGDLTEVKVMLAQHGTTLDYIKVAIDELKTEAVPNGLLRMEAVEEKVDSLRNKSFILVGICGVISALPYGKDILAFFGVH